MAAIDTIELIDNLQFAKDNADDIWSIDGEGSSYEAVKNYAYNIPASASAARVIFNNNYDLTPCRIHVRVKATLFTDISTPAKTENTQLQEWVIVAVNSYLATPLVDLSGVYAATLHIDIALTSAVAHTGTEIIVQIRSEDATPDEWTNLPSFVGPTGTPFKIDCATDSAAGQKVLSATNPTAGNLDHDGKKVFIEDTNTIAQCEIGFQTAHGADA